MEVKTWENNCTDIEKHENLMNVTIQDMISNYLRVQTKNICIYTQICLITRESKLRLV